MIEPDQVASRLAGVKRLVEEHIPFNRVLGIRVESLGDETAMFSVPYREELLGDARRPALHGGVIGAAADACGGCAVWTRNGEADRVSTIDLRVDYLRRGRPAELRCFGEVLRVGNRVGVAKISVFHPDAPEHLVAEAKGVYSVKGAATDRAESEDPRTLPAASGAGGGERAVPK
jgi:uncharacterized protein (TIGR00369 family)